MSEMQQNEEKKHSVLIVDDENSNIMSLTDILSPLYKIYAAKSGLLGLKAAEKYQPDLILLDIIMPEVDGFFVISALKNSEKTQNIPVIFVTGLNNAYDEEKGLELGAADYIPKPFSPAIVKLRVRNQLNMLEHLRTIERLSMTDQLTGLPNRRAFNNRLSSDWGRTLREKGSISVLAVDIDRFKKYNDSFGHQQGDVALQAISALFSQSLKRPGDFVSRWGGEEFIILLPNTDARGAFDVAEQVRASIQEMVISAIEKKAQKITVSIGVNTISPVQEDDVEDFISKADKALYTAKKEGRNKVVQA